MTNIAIKFYVAKEVHLGIDGTLGEAFLYASGGIRY